MSQHLAHVALVVRDYDEAVAYYTGVLGFHVVEDTPLGAGKRWLLVAPPGSHETCLLLAQAEGEEQLGHIGNQAGGRVFLFLETDNFDRDYRAFGSRGVAFCEQPRQEPYGIVAVFQDLYGNRWDLIERAKPTGTST